MIRALLRTAGIRPGRWPSLIVDWRRYCRDRAAFQLKSGHTDFPWDGELPILDEWREDSAVLGAYFFQDQIAARWIHSLAPERHVDVGSRIDGFVGHLAVFREVEVIDIRPLRAAIPNIQFHQMDLMGEIPPEWISSTDSLSCLHTIEHFGLGRYGDPVDPDGHLKGLVQLKRIVKPGGRLLLSTPIGPQRIQFNAHRVFSPETLISWFDDRWKIERSAILDDHNRIIESNGAGALRETSCHLGVGIVMARRRDTCPL